jgi:hypothetical protein
MKCRNCGFENVTGATKCGKCSIDISTICSNGHQINPTWDKCPYCGDLLATARPSPGTSIEGSGAIGGSAGKGGTIFDGNGGGQAFAGRSTMIDGAREGGHIVNKRQTMIEGMSSAKSLGKGRTELETSMPQPSRKARTMIFRSGGDKAGSDSGSAKSLGSSSKTRLVGWLVSFSHDITGKDYRVREGRNKVGVSAENDIVVTEDSNISSHHCTIMWRGGKLFIKDEMSMNGTFVNGGDVMDTMMQLNNDDMITIGKTEFKVKIL